MNFTTDLPKKQPKVTYIVASSVRCSKALKKESDIYRMHAVILYKKSSQTVKDEEEGGEEEVSSPKSIPSGIVPSTQRNSQYILCHIRRIDVHEDSKASPQLLHINAEELSSASQDRSEGVHVGAATTANIAMKAVKNISENTSNNKRKIS